jgi:hypothetical protein
LYCRDKFPRPTDHFTVHRGYLYFRGLKLACFARQLGMRLFGAPKAKARALLFIGLQLAHVG